MVSDSNAEQDKLKEEVVDKAPDPSEEIKGLSAQLDEARREKEEFLALAKRTQADFINYKHRVEEERRELEKYAKTNLLLKVLGIVDDFQRALGHLPQEDMPAQWLEGIQLIQRKLDLFLETEGISKIEAVGKEFNPLEHEALSFEKGQEIDDGKVISVIREGYKLHNKVIRAAQVTVGKSNHNPQS